MNELRPRVIPCLQIDNRALVKTRQFKDPVYLGDPINAVRIFNDLECDELIVVDIGATREGREPDYDFIEDFAAEAFMPLAYGGGITEVSQIRRLLGVGIEKVVINSAAHGTTLINDASRMVGAQSIVVSIDVKRGLLGSNSVWTRSATHNTKLDPITVAVDMEKAGAGELFVQSVQSEGGLSGYDQKLFYELCRGIRIPVIGCGGCGDLEDIRTALTDYGLSAAAAGTMFVLHGKHRAPLISYPNPAEIDSLR